MSSPNYFKCILIIVLFSSSVRTDDNFQAIACFAKYSQRTLNVTHTYLESHQACDDIDNVNRLPPQAVDVEGERQKLQDLTLETCSNLNACNLINDAHAYFECYSIAASKNVINSLEINMTATLMSIEWNDKYDEKEKELLRCHLAAKRSFLNDSLEAYTQLSNCLNSKNIQPNSRK